MRKKIALALGVIAAMLLISGVIAVVEYRQMSSRVSELITEDIDNISVSQKIAATSERFNLRILDVVTSSDSLEAVESYDLDLAIQECRDIFLELDRVRKMRLTDSLMNAFSAYMAESRNCLSVIPSDIYDSKRWYFDVLQPYYNTLTRTIDAYNEDIHEDLAVKAEDFHSGFYRSIIPGLVTVIAGLLLLLLLLIYIIAYYITPIRRMMDSMEDYIRRGRRYSYEFDGDDELHRLNRDISEIAQENVELRKRIKLLRDQIQGEDR